MRGVSPRQERSRALAAFYGAGAVLCVLGAVVPGRTMRSPSGLVGVGILLLLTGLGVRLLETRLVRPVTHALVALLSVFVAAAMVAAGDGAPAATYAMFYAWVAVFSFAFFPPQAASAQIAWALALQIATILGLADGTSSALGQVVVSGGATLATGAVVGLLTLRLRRLAGSDPLTEVANRRSVLSALERAVAVATRSGRPLAVVALDLDDFKEVNDSQGHAAGDRLLVETTRRWQSQLRHGDLLARTGGDEFLVLLPDCAPDRAAEVVARLRGVVTAEVGVSAGVAQLRAGDTTDSLLRRADRRLYRAKGRSPASSD